MPQTESLTVLVGSSGGAGGGGAERREVDGA